MLKEPSPHPFQENFFIIKSEQGISLFRKCICHQSSKNNPTPHAVILNEVKDLGPSCRLKILHRSIIQDDSVRSWLIFYIPVAADALIL